MRLKFLALATAAGGLALATQAAAGPGGHGGGIGHVIGAGGGGGMSGSLGPGMGASFGDHGRLNSQGPLNASAMGMAHANSHSVLSGASPVTKTHDRDDRTGDRDDKAGDRDNEHAEHARGPLTTVTSVTSGTLNGLADAQTVKTSSGATVGTVSKILVNASGAPVAVVVTQANGEKIRLPASSLTIASGVVTTTSKRAAQEAAETAEANPHPTSIASGVFAGLAVGDSVVTKSGKTLGTVSRITVSDNGTVRAVTVTTASGKHFALPAGRLSVSGSTVTAATASMTAHG